MLFNTIAVALVFLIALPLIVGLCLKSPKMVAVPMIAVLIMFASSTWGSLQQVESTIYSRGSGELYFSLLNILLFTTGFALLTRRLFMPYASELAPPMTPYLIGFALLLTGHAIVGTISGVGFFETIGYSGILNILNMLIFMYFMISAFKSQRDQKELLYVIIALAAIRAVFGIARFVWFGGDSANPYRNLEGLDMKLVFFDIGDNFIASIAAFWAMWQLTMPAKKKSIIKRLALLAFLALEIATVALSFRRSSLMGMALMFVFLLWQLPRKQRVYFLILAGGILFATAIIFFQQRLQYSSQGTGNFLSALIYDIAPDKKNIATDSRFYELYAAAQSIGNNWITGLGTWGTFTGDQEALSYHQGRFDFVHSGFGHIILKTGLIGLVLFCAMLWKYISYYFKNKKFLAGNGRMLADIGFSGFLFWIPTLLIGTPIVEFRTMLLIGLCLAMPFIAVGLTRQQQAYQQPHLQSHNYAIT